jgi:hypothetical protein
MLSDYQTYTAMSGNGVPILGMKTIKMHLLMAVFGSWISLTTVVYCEVERGIASPLSAVQPSATGIRQIMQVVALVFE